MKYLIYKSPPWKIKTYLNINEKEYGIILLDVTLPDGNGYDFCEEVRKSQDIPIIFLNEWQSLARISGVTCHCQAKRSPATE